LFDGITWDEKNRQEHLEYRPEVDFAVVHRLNWNRIKKRLDAEHPDDPPRFQAIVGLDIRNPPLIFFVMYSKVNGLLNVISVRLANAEERAIFFS
jgi:uncharacterized DUF497 family protein